MPPKLLNDTTMVGFVCHQGQTISSMWLILYQTIMAAITHFPLDAKASMP